MSQIDTIFSKNTWIGKNENDIIMNLFFMSVISFLFIHATIIIFPIVSDRLYTDILKKKLKKMDNLSKKVFNFKLKEQLKQLYKDSDWKTVKKERDKKNQAMIIKKIKVFRWITYLLLLISISIIFAKYFMGKGFMLTSVHLLIVLAMIGSFSTEIAIYFLVFSQYIYSPDIEMYSLFLHNIYELLQNPILRSDNDDNNEES